MNEEEFLKQYMGKSGIFEQSRAFGRRKAEEEIEVAKKLELD